jgi:hypothetical protein
MEREDLIFMAQVFGATVRTDEPKLLQLRTETYSQAEKLGKYIDKWEMNRSAIVGHLEGGRQYFVISVWY